jgi:NAD(P)H-quinone oxidoreductase subunit 4L
MSLRSSLATLGFAGIATVLVCAYCWQVLNGFWIGPFSPDLLVTAIVLILGLVAILIGADVPVVTIVATLGAFVCLTIFQSEPIRYMTLSAILFCIGLYGLVVSRNAVRVLMAIELMLNAVNINLVALSHFVDPMLIRGQVFAIFILAVAAAEAAVGLAVVLAVYRNMATVDMEKFNLLKW